MRKESAVFAGEEKQPPVSVSNVNPCQGQVSVPASKLQAARLSGRPT